MPAFRRWHPNEEQLGLAVAEQQFDQAAQQAAAANCSYTHFLGYLLRRQGPWDFENRLTSVALPGTGGTVTFKYDPFGRRIQKSSAAGTTNYLYDGSNSVEEIDATGGVLARYAQGAGIDEPLAAARGGAVGFYEQDGLGSVTSLSDSTTSLANTYTYDAFGNLTVSTGGLTNPFQYTGRDYDSETGLRYYRARF